MIWYNQYNTYQRERQVMNKGDRIKEVLTLENPDVILYDDMDDALIGVYRGNENGQAGLYEAIAVYSYVKYITILINRDSMSEEEAVEYFDYKVAGVILGKNQPIIIDDTGV